jgi:hypothetical protein
MSDEMHLAPLTGRDVHLPQVVYGYLNNPLLQENLSLLPLATCFDYAADPAAYEPGRSWRQAARELFGRSAIPHWRAMVDFCEQMNRSRDGKRSAALTPGRLRALREADRYFLRNRGRRWYGELRPWLARLEQAAAGSSRRQLSAGR